MKTDIILRDYQNESLRFLETDFEKLVLAMCPSSGKTETVIYYIDQLVKQNKNLKVLILPHSTNVLLNNFYDRLEQRNVGFTYSTDTSVECNVHILLPQSKSKIKDKYDLLIVDESHENYFAKTVQNIISKTKPKKQILLTGTPYQFIGKEDFKIHFLSLNELNKSTIPKLRVDIIESNYNWNGNYNKIKEVKKEFNFNDVDTKTTLDKTFKFILNRNNVKKKEVSKTLVICNNIKQSELVKKYLDVFGLSSVLSNSKNDAKSLLIQDFKRNKINILIVVNRARLGYDDIDLINLIDMSGTLNPNLIYQMMARVLRGANDVQKYYVRLTSKKDDSLNSEIATNLALMLTDKKYISTFNGKNFDSQTIIVPNYFSKKYITTSSNFTKNSPKLLIDTDDIISFYRDTISDIDKENGVFKFCKIKDVLAELEIKFRELTLEYCKKIASNYKTRIEWFKSHSRSYNRAQRMGWLQECCKDMVYLKKENKRSKLIRKTLEDCKKSASNFKNRRDWYKAFPNDYNCAYRNGWLEECCKDMIYLNKPPVKHTLDDLIKSASKYSTRAEWERGEPSAYFQAKSKKVLDICCKDMIYGRRTLNDCLIISSKYNSRKTFKKENNTVYEYALRKGWLEECCKDMKNDLNITNRTFEDCLREALKYKTLSEWIKSDKASYGKAKKEGWDIECYKHFSKEPKRKFDTSKLTIQDCIKDASKYLTKTDWERNSHSIYNYSKRKNWLNECLEKTGKVKIDLTLEDCIKEASKYSYKYEWVKNDSISFNIAKKNNWLDECYKYFIRAMWNTKLTFEECLIEASKYETRTAWYKSNPSSYHRARKQNWLEDCCKNMTPFFKQYTLEFCKESASKFKSRFEWAKGDNKIYRFAKKNNWLDECCENMIPFFKKHTLESCIESASKFTNFTNWKKGDKKSYVYAQRKGWYKECAKHYKK